MATGRFRFGNPAAALKRCAAAGSRLCLCLLEERRNQGVAAVFHALRHHEMNRLQIALGWAQLGEIAQVRETLEAHVLEQSVLRGLLGGASPRQQARILCALAALERHGQCVELRGETAPCRPEDAREVARALRRAWRMRVPRTVVEVTPGKVSIQFE